MRRNLRQFFVGATASVLIVGCGITTTKKTEDKRSGEDATGVTAGASVNNQQFSLSLPYLPDIKPNSHLKAYLRIYDSHVAEPHTDDCSPEKVVDIEDASSQKKGIELTQRPAKIVYEDSLEYKVGASIGPILLDPGLFTAILEVYDDSGKRFSGTSWFDVKHKSISNIEMKMVSVSDCRGGGNNSGVVITPVVSGYSGDLVSACEYSTIEPALCRPEEATCYYGDHKGYSACGLNLARQRLIDSLCEDKVRVPKSFPKQIVCESNAGPKLPKPIEPVKPTKPVKPLPPDHKARACIQLEMACNASEQIAGKGCYAKYYALGSEIEEKTNHAKSGNYCKDRHLTLEVLCHKKADVYKVHCVK